MRRISLVLVTVSLAASFGPARALPPVLAGALASSNVELVASIPDVSGIGGRILGDTMYVTNGQGLRIYDISLGIPVPKGALELPHFENEDVDTNGEILLIAADHFLGSPTLLYVIDVSNPTVPLLASVLEVSDAHTASCILDCRFAWLAGSRRVRVVDLRDPTSPEEIGFFFVPGGSHDVQVDATGVAWVSNGGGLHGYLPNEADPTNPTFVAGVGNGPGGFDNQFIIHNSLRPNALSADPVRFGDPAVDPGELLLVTEEDWIGSPDPFNFGYGNNGCKNDGSFQTGWYHSVGGAPVVERLDAFNLGQGTLPPTDRKPAAVVACSSHYLDHREGVAVVAWYEQGVRFFDVSNARDIRQIGFYMPAVTEAWNAQFKGEYVYVFDVARGLDVLRFTGTAGGATALAPQLNPTSTLSAPSPRWGYACRIPRAA